MNFKALKQYYGAFLLMLSGCFFCPLIFSTLKFKTLQPSFLVCAIVTLTLGLILWMPDRKILFSLGHQTAMFFVTATWLSASLLGALPYYFTGTTTSFVDALFESVSGFTDTGATLIALPESVNQTILLWRSLTQWLGGLGIIMFFLFLSPMLGFGGGQVFSSDNLTSSTEGLNPRTREVAGKIWFIYLGLTVILGTILIWAGMPGFDAINHALTTISTGGFSTRNLGISSFNSPAIEVIISIFMLLGAVNFALFYRMFFLHDAEAAFTTEFKWFNGITVIFTVLIALILSRAQYAEPLDALVHSFFAVSSAISSTGFPHHDYFSWPPLATFMLILLVVMGGMSGSTSGGVKVIRLVAAFKQLMKHFTQIVHPKAIISIKANEQSLPPAIVDGIWAVLFMYFLCFSITTCMLAASNLDVLSAASASFSALSNFGPAMGSLGPDNAFALLPPAAKITLSAAMLLGRLEFIAIDRIRTSSKRVRK